MSLVSRVQNILMSPGSEWPVIAGEGASVGSLYSGYIIPLAAIPPLASFISFAFLLGLGLVYGIVWALVSYVLALIGCYIIAFIAAKLAPSFGGRDDMVQGLKLTAYSYTAGWVGGIFTLIPIAGGIIALVAAIYGLYLLYLGTSPVMGVPKDKSIVYTIVLIVVAVVVTGIIGAVVGTIVGLFALSAIH